MEKFIDDFSEALITACDISFNRYKTMKKTTTHKTAPWWSVDLTVLRKRTNALRRLYQRTKNNEDFREMRKMKHYKSKATYSAAIKREKIRSWKEYCNLTTATNPWNMVYKIVADKTKASIIITTLQKSDGTLTASTTETLNLMMDNFTAQDNEWDDNEYHKKVRTQIQQPPRHSGRPRIHNRRNQKSCIEYEQ
jgi:hypothetical protein